MMARQPGAAVAGGKDADDEKRGRILHAAMETFRQHGFAAATTLEIATRARVSKRELYALVGNKQAMLEACITERVQRFGVPAEVPTPRDRAALAHLLASFGARLLRDVTDPAVIAVFRLAIAEARHAPAVAHALESTGRQAAHVALRQIMIRAQASGLLDGQPDQLAEQFRGLLWTDLMVSLLLGVAKRPSARESAERARAAAAAFLALHPMPNGVATPPR
jgi:AcrR family transcriptional regulator